MLPVYPYLNLLVQLSAGHFFYQPSTLLLHVVNIIKLHTLCHNAYNIAPSACISVSFFEIPLNVVSLMYVKLLFLVKLYSHSALMLLYKI